MNSIAICPGSFDPITIGHLNIISRTAKMFNKVIVVVLMNSKKSGGLFTPDERVEFIRRCTADIPNVERKPILIIKYLKRNFPLENINTEFINYYFFEKRDIIPNENKIDLTNEEKIGNFKLEFISKYDILKVLNKNFEKTEYKEVVCDTIDAIREYLLKEQ